MSTRDVARSLKNADHEEAREVREYEEAARDGWDAIQTGVVDEPRRAVTEADALVAQVIKRLSEVFADERTRLEGQWGHQDEVSTEDLRQALRKYRSFFERLLSL
jgi:hypothetical protein